MEKKEKKNGGGQQRGVRRSGNSLLGRAEVYGEEARLGLG